MSEINEEHRETEESLRRVRPQGPSAELKGRVLLAARRAWRQESAHVPWQIPLRRLAASAIAAVLIMSLANLYGNRASGYRPAGAPTAGFAEPCDLDAIMDVHAPVMRYMAIAGRSAWGGAPALLEHLEMVRDALREAEQTEAAEEPAPVERRSRLLPSPSSLHS